jgi:hypothetical protein
LLGLPPQQRRRTAQWADPARREEEMMGKERTRTPQDRGKRTGRASGTAGRRRAAHTPVTSLRIPTALLERADELVPLIAATGELVGASRSTVLRLALAEGLRVLRRQYAGGDD